MIQAPAVPATRPCVPAMVIACRQNRRAKLGLQHSEVGMAVRVGHPGRIPACCFGYWAVSPRKVGDNLGSNGGCGRILNNSLPNTRHQGNPSPTFAGVASTIWQPSYSLFNLTLA